MFFRSYCRWTHIRPCSFRSTPLSTQGRWSRRTRSCRTAVSRNSWIHSARRILYSSRPRSVFSFLSCPSPPSKTRGLPSDTITVRAHAIFWYRSRAIYGIIDYFPGRVNGSSCPPTVRFHPPALVSMNSYEQEHKASDHKILRYNVTARTEGSHCCSPVSAHIWYSLPDSWPFSVRDPDCLCHHKRRSTAQYTARHRTGGSYPACVWPAPKSAYDTHKGVDRFRDSYRCNGCGIEKVADKQPVYNTRTTICKLYQREGNKQRQKALVHHHPTFSSRSFFQNTDIHINPYHMHGCDRTASAVFHRCFPLMMQAIIFRDQNIISSTVFCGRPENNRKVFSFPVQTAEVHRPMDRGSPRPLFISERLWIE